MLELKRLNMKDLNFDKILTKNLFSIKLTNNEMT